MEKENASKKNDPAYLGKATTPKVAVKTLSHLWDAEKESKGVEEKLKEPEEKPVSEGMETTKTGINIVDGLTPPKEIEEAEQKRTELMEEETKTGESPPLKELEQKEKEKLDELMKPEAESKEENTKIDKAEEPITADKVASEGWRNIDGVQIRFETIDKNGGTFLKALFKEDLRELEYRRNLRFTIECDKERMKKDPIYAENHHKKVKALNSLRDDLRLDVAFPLDVIEVYVGRILENIRNNNFRTKNGELQKFSTQTVRAIRRLCDEHLAKFEEVRKGGNKKEQKPPEVKEEQKPIVYVEI